MSYTTHAGGRGRCKSTTTKACGGYTSWSFLITSKGILQGILRNAFVAHSIDNTQEVGVAIQQCIKNKINTGYCAIT